MDFEYNTPAKEADSHLPDLGIDEAQPVHILDEEGEPRAGEHPEVSPEIHDHIVRFGKIEAAAGEAILADMKPHWLACVLATMCAIEEHGRSGAVHEA